MMNKNASSANKKMDGVKKTETGIQGLDHIAMGGLPVGRTTLISGTSGSAKTIFAVQYLVEGIHKGESAVFITFEELPKDIRSNMLSFGWDIEQWEKEGKWAFVDASPRAGETTIEAGSYNLDALLLRIKAAVERTGATRLSLDSLGAIFSQFSDQSLVRRELFHIVAAMKDMELTAVITAERVEEYGEIARFGVEEFVADNVVILRNGLEAEKRRRTIEILKFRGTNHRKGEFPFTVMPGKGVIVIPLSEIRLEQKSAQTRTTSGNKTLDTMCDGGLFRDSILLISGATGCGKTLLTTEYVSALDGPEERSMLFAFEESRDQLFRNATGWGQNFGRMEKEGRLKVIAAYPETAGLEDHLIMMRDQIDAFKPTRIAVDSLSALERVSTLKGYREFVIGITAYLKEKQITGLFTSTTSSLMGGESITEQHISTITDSIILLRYVEMFGEMKRGLTVLKMRGSRHDKDIREYTIDEHGMTIGGAFRNVTGILSGNPKHVPPHEVERLSGMFGKNPD